MNLQDATSAVTGAVSSAGTATANTVRQRPAESLSGVTGSLSGLIIWVLSLFHVETPPEAAAGIVVVVGWVAALVTRKVVASRG